MEYTSAFITRNPKTKGWRGMVNYKQDGKWKKREKSFPQARNKTEARRLLEDWKKELGFETPSLDVDALQNKKLPPPKGREYPRGPSKI